MKTLRPISLHIDSDAVLNNFNIVQKNAFQSNIYAVIKANAYGNDDEFIFNILKNKASGFSLLELPRALFFREKTDQPLLLLEGVFGKSEALEAAENQITTVCHCEEQLAWAAQAAKKTPNLRLALKLNTGMNRLGFTIKTLPKALKIVEKLANAQWILMAHFARADEENGVDSAFSTFQKMRDWAILHAPFLKNAKISLANSAAILAEPKTHGDIVRPGIMLYGASPFGTRRSAQSLGLKPVMTLKSQIIAIQHVEKGAQVGYGGNFTAPESMPIGIVACGYADGYPRIAQNAPVLVNGVKTKTIGKVAMDMLCVDLRPIQNATIGAEVELFGENISADCLAESAQTIAYEIFCAIAARVPRIYKNLR